MMTGTATAVGANSDVFHVVEALERTGGSPELLCELIDLAVKDFTTQTAAIRTGLETADGPLIKRAAHQLKGTALSLSAQRVVLAARELEQLSAARDWGSVANGMSALAQELATAARAFREFAERSRAFA